MDRDVRVVERDVRALENEAICWAEAAAVRRPA
jgi:hypothetical protein